LLTMDTEQFTSGPEITRPVEYNSRELILYALGINSNDPRFTYELHDDFAAFPTYPIVLTFKGAEEGALPFPSDMMKAFPEAPLEGVKVLLDAEKIIEKVNELPKDGARLTMVGRTVGVHKKGSGAFVEQVFKIVDDTGKVYYRLVDGKFLVGAKDFKDSGVTHSKTAPPPEEAPTHTLEEKTLENIASLYRLSGDYNPLHVDPNIAGKAGFEKPIMHGQCTLGHVARQILDAVANGDQKKFKSIQLRFAAPVYPGETLLTEVWKVSATEFIFQTKVKETGKVCVNNGRFFLNPEAPKIPPAADGATEMKVTAKRSAAFYAASACSFLRGVEAKPAEGDKPAVEAKPAVNDLRISGLGEAINTAVSAALKVEAEGLGTITRVQTAYPEMDGSGRGVPQVFVDVKKK